MEARITCIVCMLFNFRQNKLDFIQQFQWFILILYHQLLSVFTLVITVIKPQQKVHLIYSKQNSNIKLAFIAIQFFPHLQKVIIHSVNSKFITLKGTKA